MVHPKNRDGAASGCGAPWLPPRQGCVLLVRENDVTNGGAPTPGFRHSQAQPPRRMEAAVRGTAALGMPMCQIRRHSVAGRAREQEYRSRDLPGGPLEALLTAQKDITAAFNVDLLTDMPATAWSKGSVFKKRSPIIIQQRPERGDPSAKRQDGTTRLTSQSGSQRAHALVWGGSQYA